MKKLQPSSAGSPLLRRALSPDRLHPRSAEGKKVWLLTWVPWFPTQYPPNFSFVLLPKQFHCKLASQQYWLVFQVAAISPLCSPPCKSVGGLGEHRTTKHSSTSPLPSRYTSQHCRQNNIFVRTLQFYQMVIQSLLHFRYLQHLNMKY